ncbi:hypothetical protein HZH66_012065 [Vespula vulgaris]|uniref:Uncharacterized protein n=1 Tax=Vespula vulgaris TaxID=7454 RepID=A0A834MVA5_VESVU|nr:hypothetical protein HZH66_012065 [Vespula vulgaris]
MAQTLSTGVSRPQSLPWKPCSPRCSVQNNVKAFARRRPDSVLERIYDRSHGSNETQFDWAIYVENGTSNGHGSNANCCLSAPGTRGRANRVYDRMGTAGIVDLVTGCWMLEREEVHRGFPYLLCENVLTVVKTE